MNNKADISLTDADGFSLAHFAAMCGEDDLSAATLQMLAEISVDIHGRSMENELTPLHLACTIGNRKVHVFVGDECCP